MTAASLSRATTDPFWWDAVDFGAAELLADDLDVDVAIVGAGYTGLWTAYSLLENDPALRIAILEAQHVGFGASGRNGGWCYDGFAAGLERIEKMSDLTTAQDFGAALREMVDVIAKVVASEGIDCDLHKGGTIEFLRNGGQVGRAAEDVASSRRYGWSHDEVRILGAAEAQEIARAADIEGGLWSAHTAAIQPAKLAVGLATSLRSRGVRIYERTPVTAITPGRILTAGGATVRATATVQATEGYTADLEGHHRTLAPLYSLMIATAPLPDALWDEVGLADRQTFGDLRHLVIYGQRTADGRIAFGGRGAPYDYGSRIRRNAEFPVDAFAPVREALVEVFPQLADVEVTHRWGGVLGVSRTWFPTVHFDPVTGIGSAGGYVGSGVAATNLAGRTLADLITGRTTRLTRFPWVNHHVRKWEPEPLRWIGVNAALRVMAGADEAEAKTDKPSKRAHWLWRLAKK
jgi:glycine/D-amino acid oxidase-like deaminating enzyme